jgi:hypothetical protein
MGLGCLPGVVTVTVSCLADRYERRNNNDEAFFAGSGGSSQQGKRSDIQAVVLSTTREVIEGMEGYFYTDYY